MKRFLWKKKSGPPPAFSIDDYLTPEEKIKLSGVKTEQLSEKKPDADLIKCPKCRSSQIVANKKGFGLGKAAVSGVLTGGVGLLAGFLGSRKIYLTCLHCGNKWGAGKS